MDTITRCPQSSLGVRYYHESATIKWLLSPGGYSYHGFAIIRCPLSPGYQITRCPQSPSVRNHHVAPIIRCPLSPGVCYHQVATITKWLLTLGVRYHAMTTITWCPLSPVTRNHQMTIIICCPRIWYAALAIHILDFIH